MQRKLTQEKFAALIDRTPDAVSMIERGINFPSRETLEKMSKALNIPIKEFLFIGNDNLIESEKDELVARITSILYKLDGKSLEMALKHIEVLESMGK